MSESFEGARLFTEVMFPDCEKSMLDRLQKAHEHDLEHMCKARFHEGYVAGQRSMDADHAAAAMRLRRLRFDGGSHENLGKVAYAIYPCATGWTVESCEGLRDRIIDLLGGVHECGADCGGRGAGCVCADTGGGEQEAVDVDDSVSDVRADVPAADGVGDLAAAQVTYDVLGNERHKAVCKLRGLQEDYPEFFFDALHDAIGCHTEIGESATAHVRDRLIHLLGGDEPNFTKIAETINLGGKHDSKLMENGENHKIATITDELRECVNTATKTYDNTFWHEMGDESEADHTICHITEGELLRVADSIDEWFKRLCEQQEAVLQQTIDSMVDERDELQAKLDEADAAIANYREREKSFVESERLREELRRSLREIAEHAGVFHDEDLDRYSDNLVAKATLAKIDGMHQYVVALEWQRDRQKGLLDEHDQTRDELQAKLDAIREALDG